MVIKSHDKYKQEAQETNTEKKIWKRAICTAICLKALVMFRINLVSMISLGKQVTYAPGKPVVIE